MRNKRALPLTAIATLALGIGASVAVITVAETLLLRPLPVANEERLALLWGETPDGKFANVPLTLSELESFQRQARTLDRVAYHTFWGASPVAFRAGDQPLQLDVALVSGNYFDVIGARPALGRTLGVADDVKGAAPALVLGHYTWRQRFGGDSSVIGRTLTLATTGRAYQVVGVMPPGLDYPRGTDVWAPLTAYSSAEGFHEIAIGELDIVARLTDGATLAQAASELTNFFATLPAGGFGSEARGVAHGFRDLVLGDARPAMRIVLLASILLLVVACINVANLQLVRALGRASELVVRAALGASRAQLVRHQLREAVVLSIGGGLVGVAFAAILVRLFLAFAPAGLPRVDEISLDATMLLAALGVSAFAVVAAGLAPALFALRVDAGDALRSGTRHSDGRRLRLTGELLVGTQVALAVVALASAGLVGRSLANLYRIDMAFDSVRLTVAELVLRRDVIGGRDQQAELVSRIVTRIEAMPGVTGVTPVLNVPFIAGGGGIDGRISIPGQTTDERAKNPVVNMEVVSPSYFTVLGVPVLRGRPFTDDDRVGSTPVAIVSASTARALWPDREAVGRQLGPNGEFTVVGVIPDLRYRELEDARPSVYFPLAQPRFPMTPTTLVMRTDDGALSAAQLRSVIAEIDAGVTVASVATLAHLLESPRAQPRLNALVLGLFAAGAMILAAIGLFSVMATMVRRRTRELGIRMALGASRSSVGNMVLKRGLAIACAGTIAGLVGARLVGSLLSDLLFEVRPTDATTLAGVAAAVISVAALASFFPARAGASVDPVNSLRAE
jgi:predicted permease